MKSTIIATFILFCSSFFGQGLYIEPIFYCDSIPEMSSKKINEFWHNEVDRLKSSIDESDSYMLYCFAISQHNSGAQNLPELIQLLDKAIELNPKEPKFYAVRGILKFNWGAWTSDFDISESCPDIKKAISMGMASSLQECLSVTQILAHSSCK